MDEYGFQKPAFFQRNPSYFQFIWEANPNFLNPFKTWGDGDSTVFLTL